MELWEEVATACTSPRVSDGAWLVCKCLQNPSKIGVYYIIWTPTQQTKRFPFQQPISLQASLPRKDRGHRLFAPLLGRLNTGLGDVHDPDGVPKNPGTWAKEHEHVF